jgi:hypothetical protein
MAPPDRVATLGAMESIVTPPETKRRKMRSPVPSLVFLLIAVVGIGAIMIFYRRLGFASNFMFSSCALFLGIVFLLEFIWDHLSASDDWMTAEPWLPLPARLEPIRRLWPLGMFVVGVVGGHLWWF